MMKPKKNSREDRVKKDKMIILALFTLIAGFMGGGVLSAYRPILGIPYGTLQDQQIAKRAKALIPQLEEETKRTPENPQAWTRLANIYFDTEQFEKAIGAYKKSLELVPDNADILTDLGVMYRRNGQPEKAVTTFNTAVEINPEHETARFNKGIVLMHDLGDKAGAIVAWQELLRRNPLAMTPTGQSVDEVIQHYTNHVN